MQLQELYARYDGPIPRAPQPRIKWDMAGQFFMAVKYPSPCRVYPVRGRVLGTNAKWILRGRV